MPEELGKGLYLAGVGMGLVFAALVVFMVVLFVLKRVFPGEDVPETTLPSVEASGVVEQALAPEMAASPATLEYVSIPGARIAVAAVGAYMAMEYGFDPADPGPVLLTGQEQSSGRSAWAQGGRVSLVESQGHRPLPQGRHFRSHGL